MTMNSIWNKNVQMILYTRNAFPLLIVNISDIGFLINSDHHKSLVKKNPLDRNAHTPSMSLKLPQAKTVHFSSSVKALAFGMTATEGSQTFHCKDVSTCSNGGRDIK